MTNKNYSNKQKVKVKALSIDSSWQIQQLFTLAPLFIILAALIG